MGARAMMRNIKLLKYYTISMNFLPCIAVLIPYYSQHIGLSFQDFLYAEAIFAAVVFALEVPSGWISDVWKRKSVLMLAAAIFISGFGLLIFADSFLDAAFAQAWLGIAVSLFSGTNSALLYDSLLAEGREKEFSKQEGRRVGIGLYSFAISSILGGILYEINPQLPIYITVLAGLPAILSAYLMVEPPRVKSAITVHPIKDMLVTMRYALHGHTEIAFIIIFAAILFSSTKLIMWMQQPYYMALNIPEFYFGILMAVGAILGGVSSQLGHHIDGHISNIKLLFIVFLSAIAICFLSGFFMSYVGVALLMLGGSCLFGMSNPRIDNAINSRIDSSRRATILSTKNLLVQLFFIPSSLIIGILIDKGGISFGLYGIIGWLMLGGFCIAAWEFYKHKRY